MTCLVEKTIATLVGTSIDSLLLLKMLYGTLIKKLVNLDIAVSLIMTNLQPSTQKIEPLGMLKQPLILLKK
ncbi:hypothetical protein Godav_000138 [Gossypium davidsonii]|uniref:Uncharacterized protein n=1 Tax=Gossypium davidsonii TaxID=34287 RepID=A0A7J8TFK9_GOSDV|nr:hypothetical protein [Gossypium davidsonii]